MRGALGAWGLRQVRQVASLVSDVCWPEAMEFDWKKVACNLQVEKSLVLIKFKYLRVTLRYVRW